MSDLYKQGWKDGFEAGKTMSAYELFSFDDDYRVGYAIGRGETQYVSVPPDYRWRFIGELASELRVPLEHFERLDVVDDWEEFKRGYLGDEIDDAPYDDEDD